MANIIKISEGANPNYLATVCKIESVFPIEGKDRIVRTVLNGYDMIIPKTMPVGTTVIYLPVESALSAKFLSANNLYDRGEFERNGNVDEVKALLEKLDSEKDAKAAKEIAGTIKGMCGFFNKYGRVRILKLGATYSQGFITGVDTLEKVYPELAGTDWDSLVGTQFNIICDEEFCWKFIPPMKNSESTPKNDQKIWKKRMRKLAKFDRMIEGTFAFHYDTKQLGEHFDQLNPTDVVSMTVKLHGTSAIFANIPVRRELSCWEKVKKFFGVKVADTEFGNVFSSRSTIKNQYINENATPGFYESDIWGCVNRDIKHLIPENWTIYGEIVGYVEGKQTMIQKNHDYGCEPGTWKFMPYRISQMLDNGDKFEWNVSEVIEWTEKIIKENPELSKKIIPMTLLYHGKFMDLYKDIPTDENWRDNVLARMKADKTNFLMELDEPLCTYHHVPREGIVIRIDNDQFARAWKLKTMRHYGKEAEAHDAGEVDMEENA